MLQPFVLDKLVGPAPCRLPEGLLFPVRSTEYLPQYYLTRCAPSRGEWLLSPANKKNCGAWRVQSDLMPSGPLQQDYTRGSRDPPPKIAPGLMRSYPSVPLLLRSPRPSARGKRRSLRNATRTWPQKPDCRRPALSNLPHETEHSPSARFEHHASRIVERTRNRPKSSA